MGETSMNLIAFGAFLVITVSGLADVLLGSYLLMFVAYLSVWMPTTTWLALCCFILIGVAIAASSAVAAIATMISNKTAIFKCSVVLILVLLVEIGGSALLAVREHDWSKSTYNEIKDSMQDTLVHYTTNATSAAMWDEIQKENPCCGVVGYSDWFKSGYSNGMSVPDSCCLLPSAGCGYNVRSRSDVSDLINVDGCLPVLVNIWTKTYRVVARYGLLTVLIVQIVMMGLILFTQRSFLWTRAGLVAVRRSPMKQWEGKQEESSARYHLMS